MPCNSLRQAVKPADTAMQMAMVNQDGLCSEGKMQAINNSSSSRPNLETACSALATRPQNHSRTSDLARQSSANTKPWQPYSSADTTALELATSCTPTPSLGHTSCSYQAPAYRTLTINTAAHQHIANANINTLQLAGICQPMHPKQQQKQHSRQAKQ